MGFETGERIIVPPKYRKILPPVGVYCALKRAPAGGGDGTGRESDGGSPLPEVDIENNGTVHLDRHSGKVKTVKL